MRILITGVSGFVGAALAPRLAADGHELIGVARDPSRVDPALPLAEVARADLIGGEGLAAALDGVEVAYYLIHSMEPSQDGRYDARERQAADAFADAASDAGVRRIVYLGGPVPSDRPPSPHLRSRLAVEHALLSAVPGSIALRASIVIGARSRSFRFLVRLVERLPLLPLPAWQRFRTQPIDERDMVGYLAAAATAEAAESRSLDIAGPQALSYGEMIERIADALLVGRQYLPLGFSLTPVASAVAARVAGERLELVGPLMSSLDGDLIVDDSEARELFGVRLHSFDAAVEHALREWESREVLRAR
jgi:uncharacterized protein YbjT (DUF2867 family)